MKLFGICRSGRFAGGVFLVLLFFGALFWAREQDPFSRRWFWLKANGWSFQCVAVLPKPVERRPVVIFAHDAGGSLMTDGFVLRQMAEMGLAVVSLEYDQSNGAAFDGQFTSALDYVARQRWADTNALAWVGSSLGAERMKEFASRHPERQPRLMVQLSGAGSGQAGCLSRCNCEMLLIHGDQDQIFPMADTEKEYSLLHSNGVVVELKVMRGLAHGLEPERGVIFRAIGEHCRSRLVDGWKNYHSIAQWEAEAPGLWWFWLPAVAWLAGWFGWRRRPRVVVREKVKLTRVEIVLRGVAVVLGVWAATVTALHLMTPQLEVSGKTISIARRMLVQPKEMADFEALACRPIWQGQKLKTLLDQVELAGYNRGLVNWTVDDTIYREQVLQPVITGKVGERLDWRRPLWEEFYPRIRHESSPADAAQIVVRHLRERVTIADVPGLPQEVPDIWLRQITDETGFEIIYVAALRSVGVPARLGADGHTEFFDGGRWQAAPEPAVVSW